MRNTVEEKTIRNFTATFDGFDYQNLEAAAELVDELGSSIDEVADDAYAVLDRGLTLNRINTAFEVLNDLMYLITHSDGGEVQFILE